MRNGIFSIDTRFHPLNDWMCRKILARHLPLRYLFAIDGNGAKGERVVSCVIFGECGVIEILLLGAVIIKSIVAFSQELDQTQQLEE